MKRKSRMKRLMAALCGASGPAHPALQLAIWNKCPDGYTTPDTPLCVSAVRGDALAHSLSWGYAESGQSQGITHVLQ